MKFSAIATFLLGHCICSSQGQTETAPTVTTPLGTIEGFYNTTQNGRLYEAYQGIPYAEPPIGDLRFEVPRPISPWCNVLQAKNYSSRCTQPTAANTPGSTSVTGSEDCLYLNVYTPLRESNESTAALFPVIFFIHGGAFKTGGGMDYKPTYLLDFDVVFITMNYRLGTLGFLSTEDEIIPGNMGLKDQVMALRWVQKNIESFGGDPDRVMIVGHSAGGASVHFHYMTDLTSGLFNSGMSISGTALDCWCQTEASLEKARKVASIVGCPTSEVRSMVDCLKTQPADQIAVTLTQFETFVSSPYSPFGPVVEMGDGEFTMIDRPPIESITSGNVHDLPWITSVVSEEGLVPAAAFINNDTLLQTLNDNWTSIAPELLEFNYTIPQADHADVSELIRRHYIGYSDQINKTTIPQLVTMIGDRLYNYDAEIAATTQAEVVSKGVWFYYFTYRGNHSFSEYYSGGSTVNYGVSHLDDLAYVLDCFFNTTTTAEDREMQKVMINMWVSFAESGKPDLGVDWEELSKSGDEFSYMKIAGPEDLYMENNENFGQKKFWLSIGFDENTLEYPDYS
ncbi:venom carboxylesterase-6-like [Diprion similis]|uniref:venom carboxylesterase-6-like n=1 Tax=Diprion similis TaxID=362088 RepID=UPI001EF8E5CE|nr:venom carboxylesterase-6-like [Diprion similis]